MKNKKSRLPIIVDLLSHKVIDCQETLLTLLQNQGINITQATLSRDLRRLKATKITLEDGRFRYMILDPFAVNTDDNNSTLHIKRTVPREKLNQDILSFAISRNLIVIKTRNGCAGGLAYDIDMLRLPEILGTIPGTDTLLVVVDENLTREQIVRLLMELIPDAIASDSSDSMGSIILD